MPRTIQEIQAEAQRQFQEFQNTQGGSLFSQLGAGFNRATSAIADLPSRIAFGDDFGKLRELNPATQTETARKPRGFLQKAARFTGEAVPEVALDAAIVAGTGGLGVGAKALGSGVIRPLVRQGAGGFGAGAIRGAATPEDFGFDKDQRLASALTLGTAGGAFGAFLPPALRPLGKYIPGINKIATPVTLREAFGEALESAAFQETRAGAKSLLPTEDIADVVFPPGSALKVRALAESMESAADLIENPTGLGKTDLPFRTRPSTNPQFVADTVIQRGLKQAGLTSQQAKFMMKHLTGDERRLLRPGLDPLTDAVDSAGLPVTEAMARVIDRAPDTNTVLAVQKELAQLMADDALLQKSLTGKARAALPSGEKVAAARKVAEEVPMEGNFALMGPDIMEELNGGAQQRLAAKIGQRAKQLGAFTHRGITKMSELLTDFRISSMLTSLTAPFKNVTFAALNTGANVAGRATAGALDTGLHATGQVKARRVFAGEALAQIKGLFRGTHDVLSHYGTASRHTREQLGRTSIPVINVGSRFLKWQDNFAFNRIFAGEMHAAAFAQARKMGLKGAAAADEASRILQKEADELGPLFQSMKTKATEMATAEQAADDVWVSRTAAKLLRESGQEPVSIAESRLMAERAIFVAREGRQLDKYLDSLDSADRALAGLISVVKPFRRTPANEMREFTRSAGFDALGGVLVRMNADIAAGVPDDIAKTRAVRDYGKGIVGAGVTTMTALASAMGGYEIIGFEGKSRALRETERAAGLPSRSIRIGDWVAPLHVMGPIGRFAELGEIVTRTRDPEEAERAYLAMGREVAKIGIDELFGDFAGFFDAVESDQGMQRYMERVGASFVPGIFKQGVRKKDPSQNFNIRPDREPRGLGQALQAGVDAATAREGQVRVGIFGQRDLKRSPLGQNIDKTPPRIRAVAEHLLEIGAAIEPPDTDLSGVNFTPEDETNFAIGKGQLQLRVAENLISDPRYAALPNDRKAALLLERIGNASTEANKRARIATQNGIPITSRLILTGRN